MSLRRGLFIAAAVGMLAVGLLLSGPLVLLSTLMMGGGAGAPATAACQPALSVQPTTGSSGAGTPSPPASPTPKAGSSASVGFTISPSTPYREGQTAGSQTLVVTPVMLSHVATMRTIANQVFPGDQPRADRALLIAVITSVVETGLTNLASRAVPESMNYPNDGIVAGDADSVGLFQQRVHLGAYGSAAQIMDPAYSTRMFMGSPPPGAPKNRAWGLADFQATQGVDFMTVDPGEVAADIQRPAEAFRYRYGLWVTAASTLIQAATGVQVDHAQMGTDCYTTTGSPQVAIPAGDTYLPYWQQNGSGSVDPWNFYWGECVSYVAYMIRTTTTYSDFTNYWTHNHRSAKFGNANQWPAAARTVGIPVDTTPAVGAVAYRSSGPWGHVAIVTAVHPDGSINVAEYNHTARHRFGVRANVPWQLGAFDGFIHFEQAGH